MLNARMLELVSTCKMALCNQKIVLDVHSSLDDRFICIELQIYFITTMLLSFIDEQESCKIYSTFSRNDII